MAYDSMEYFLSMCGHQKQKIPLNQWKISPLLLCKLLTACGHYHATCVEILPQETNPFPFKKLNTKKLLVCILIVLLVFLFCMETGSSRFTSSRKFLAISLSVLAVLSPLYIDSLSEEDEEPEEELFGFMFSLPVLLLFLVLAIALSLYCDQSLTRFDPNWIHRLCGSFGGLLVILILLVFVLKCKSSAQTLQWKLLMKKTKLIIFP